MSVYIHLKYKTKFKDKEALINAFKMENINYTEKDDELMCNIGFYNLHFKKNKNGEYEINATGYDDWKDDIKSFRNKLAVHYEKLTKDKLQEQICNDIKENIANSLSMKLESEVVLEDNSILLTIVV